MKIKRYGVESELLRVECELLDMALDSEGELREYVIERDVIGRARLMGAAAVRLLEQSNAEDVLALVREAQDILEQADRLTRPFTAEIKNGMIRVAIDGIVAALDLLEDIDDAQEATGATEDATDDDAETNPYQALADNLKDAAALLRVSGALLPEFVEMRKAGLHKARLMLAIALAELCE